MAHLIIRDLDEDVSERLQKRAARHGRSMEAEARDILRDALKQDDEPSGGLDSRIAARFRSIGLRPDEEIGELRGARFQNPFED